MPSCCAATSPTESSTPRPPGSTPVARRAQEPGRGAPRSTGRRAWSPATSPPAVGPSSTTAGRLGIHGLALRPTRHRFTAEGRDHNTSPSTPSASRSAPSQRRCPYRLPDMSPRSHHQDRSGHARIPRRRAPFELIAAPRAAASPRPTDRPRETLRRRIAGDARRGRGPRRRRTGRRDVTHPHAISQAFGRIARRAGVTMIRLHDLRHPHGTFLLAAGVPVELVSEPLGSATPTFTFKTYQHVLPGLQADAARTLERPIVPGVLPGRQFRRYRSSRYRVARCSAAT